MGSMGLRWLPIAISERKCAVLPRFNRVESRHGKNLAMAPGCLVRLWSAHSPGVIPVPYPGLPKTAAEADPGWVAAPSVWEGWTPAPGLAAPTPLAATTCAGVVAGTVCLYVTVHASLCRSGPQRQVPAEVSHVCHRCQARTRFPLSRIAQSSAEQARQTGHVLEGQP